MIISSTPLKGVLGGNGGYIPQKNIYDYINEWIFTISRIIK
jgi:hypothetical protein